MESTTNSTGTESSKSFPVYLDYNATTPVDEQVIEVVSQSLKAHWGNPSSFHVFGQQAKEAIEQSRGALGRMLNANPVDIIFTSGGTEANNFALLSLIKSAQNKNPALTPHVLTSNVEHDSVANVLRELERLEQIGHSYHQFDNNVLHFHKAKDDFFLISISNLLELSVVAVDQNGQLYADDVVSCIKDNTCAISIMHANNETGVIMPIEEIGVKLEKVNMQRKAEGKSQVFFHCDAAQTIGKIQVDVKSLRVDLLTVVGHKFYGPRIGALYCKDLMENATSMYPLLQGGGQERGFRPGTENTPMIVGLGKAAELVHENLHAYTEIMMGLAETLRINLQDSIPGLKINFSNAPNSLPNTVSVCLPEGLQATTVLKEKCKDKLLASLGAACHSNIEKPSAILLASGLSPAEASRTIRLSVGRTTTKEDIYIAVKTLKMACLNEL